MSPDALAPAELQFVQWLAARLDRSARDVLDTLLTPPEAPGLVATLLTDGRLERLSLRAMGLRLRWADDEHLSLPLQGLTALTELDVTGLALDRLDLTEQRALTRLEAGDNELTHLELRANRQLQVLVVPGNDLMVLDLTLHGQLWFCDCTGNALTAILIQRASALKTLRCGRNQLMVLDLQDLPQLTELCCPRNALVRLVARAPRLRVLDARSNDLTELELECFPALQQLTVSQNRLGSLELEHCPNLRELACSRNYLDDLQLGSLTRLERVQISNNQLHSLSLGRCPALVTLDCSKNQLTSLDLASCPSLLELRCASNALQSLELSGTPELCSLSAAHNALTTFDTRDTPPMARLDLTGNPLTTVDLRGSPRLAHLTWDGAPSFRATPRLLRRLEALRGPAPEELEAMNRWEAHTFAVRCDDPDREVHLLPLVTSPERCALGTAVMIYWMASPHYYLQFADRDEVPVYALSGWDLLMAIEDRVRDDDYPHDDVFFDPRHDQQTLDPSGTDWTREPALSRPHSRTIPRFMGLARGT